MFKPQKPSFFGNSSNGKKAFPGSFSGPTQKKQTTKAGKPNMQVKHMNKSGKPAHHKKKQTSGTGKHVIQMYAAPKPMQKKQMKPRSKGKK